MKKKIKLIQINVIFVLLIQWLTSTENWVQMMRVRNLTYPHADSILIFWARGCALWYCHVSIFKFIISFSIMFQFSLIVQVNKENYRTLSGSRCCHAIFHYLLLSFERQISWEKQDFQSMRFSHALYTFFFISERQPHSFSSLGNFLSFYKLACFLF